MLQTDGSEQAECWFDSVNERDLIPKSKEQPTAGEPLFECSVPGCTQAFALFSDPESHLHIGQHMTTQKPSERLYDKGRKDWAENMYRLMWCFKQEMMQLFTPLHLRQLPRQNHL